MFCSVFTLYLFHEEFGIRVDLERRHAAISRFLDASKERLILGAIVGGDPDMLRYGSTLVADNEDYPDTRIPGVATGSSVTEEDGFFLCRGVPAE